VARQGREQYRALNRATLARFACGQDDRLAARAAEWMDGIGSPAQPAVQVELAEVLGP